MSDRQVPLYIICTLLLDFDDGAIYSESIVTEQDSESDTKVLPVSLLPFFHHLLSRKDCEQLLQEEGDFLLRESQSKRGQYVISGLYQGKYQHLLFLAQNGKVLYSYKCVACSRLLSRSAASASKGVRFQRILLTKRRFEVLFIDVI